MLEETGIQLRDVRFEYAVNSVFESGAHYVTIFMRAEVGEVGRQGWVKSFGGASSSLLYLDDVLRHCCTAATRAAAWMPHAWHPASPAAALGCMQDAQPQTLEPDKCEGWVWVPYSAVPAPVFLPLAKLLASPYGFEPAAGR